MPSWGGHCAVRSYANVGRERDPGDHRVMLGKPVAIPPRRLARPRAYGGWSIHGGATNDCAPPGCLPASIAIRFSSAGSMCLDLQVAPGSVAELCARSGSAPVRFRKSGIAGAERAGLGGALEAVSCMPSLSAVGAVDLSRHGQAAPGGRGTVGRRACSSRWRGDGGMTARGCERSWHLVAEGVGRSVHSVDGGGGDHQDVVSPAHAPAPRRACGGDRSRALPTMSLCSRAGGCVHGGRGRAGAARRISQANACYRPPARRRPGISFAGAVARECIELRRRSAWA